MQLSQVIRDLQANASITGLDFKKVCELSDGTHSYRVTYRLELPEEACGFQSFQINLSLSPATGEIVKSFESSKWVWA